MSTNGSEADFSPGTPLVHAEEVQTLFLVVISLDGQSRVVLDPEARFTAQRLATPNDVYPSLANVLADYQAIKTAEAVMSFQSQMARQVVEQQAAAEQHAAEHEKTP